MTEKTAAEFVMKTLRDAGFEAFLVGGVVRDLVLGREPHDYDVTTNARPEQVTPLFEKTTPVGAAFGVVVVVVEDVQIQVATYRADGAYSDGRRPDEVTYSDSAEDDVVRRDFTMNGLLTADVLAVSYTEGTLGVVDYVGGLEDIRNKVIRCIGNPFDRFKEDALRMLRAVRFAATLGFDIEAGTYAAIVNNVDLIKNVSRERIREELEKLVAAPYPTKGLVPLVASGLFDAIFNTEDKGYSGDFSLELTFQHTLQRFDRFAAVGKPKLGIAMLMVDCPTEQAIERALQSLKFSTEDYKEIFGAIVHQEDIDRGGNYADIRLLAREPGVLKYGVDLFEQTAYLFYKYAVNDINEVVGVFEALTEEDIHPIPMVTGKDLIAMGYKPGPMFTQVLRKVEYHQLNGDFDSAETALGYAKELVESILNPVYVPIQPKGDL